MNRINAENTIATLQKHILADGYDFVLDFEKSQGSYLHDARSGQKYLDFFSFFASLPVGFNHPMLQHEPFLKAMHRVCMVKPSNSDVYSTEYAEFVDTFAKIAGRPGFSHFFFISGGALAVENALKAAFDWKVRKNLAAGKGELGSQVIHFREAFHGRSGYTMSLTNTDIKKTQYFPKFNWPRILNPKCIFPMTEENTHHVMAQEQEALTAIHQAIAANPDDIAALIIEPIQSEGGDNHFRPEFLMALRQICNEHEIIFIADEVQTGIGLTGKMWCYEHFDFQPDIVVFGKKTQICGIMSNKRVNEVDSVFKVPSRINSTFGGNLVDMVRCQRYLEIIEQTQLLDHVNQIGPFVQAGLRQIALETGAISNVRGRGLLIAFDCETPSARNHLIKHLYHNHMIVLACGEKSVRLRPSLTLTQADAETGLDILAKSIRQEMEAQAVNKVYVPNGE